MYLGYSCGLLLPQPSSLSRRFPSFPGTGKGLVFPQIVVVVVAFPGFAMQARLDAAKADAWSTNSGASIILYPRRQVPDGGRRHEVINSSKRAAP